MERITRRAWVIDGYHFAVPNGVDPARVPVILDLMAFLLTKSSQAYAYEKGYL